MKIVKQAKLMLANQMKGKLKFSEMATDKGPLFWEEEGELEVGYWVWLITESGEYDFPPDGDYATETRIVTVEDGTVAKIADKDGSSATAEEEMKNKEKSVSREEFNTLFELTKVLAESQKGLLAEISSLKGSVEKFSKESPASSANANTSVKDYSGLTPEEMYRAIPV